MVMVDDATGLMWARFAPKESTRAWYDLFEQWVNLYGVPRGIYADRHSIYQTQREATIEEQIAGKESKTQFGRAMEQLGVKLIAAQSPQAKGRVERMNGTLQDRLVKALRLKRIDTIEEANAYLAKEFLPELNSRFKREAGQKADLHRAKPKQFEEILSWEEQRVVQRDWSVKWGKERYQVDRKHEGLSLAGKRITVRRLRDESVQLLYKGKKLKWEKLPERAPRENRDKQVDGRVKKAEKPSENHPWRRMGRAGAERAERRRAEKRE